MIGSTTGWNMILGSCDASNVLARVCGRAKVSPWKIFPSRRCLLGVGQSWTRTSQALTSRVFEPKVKASVQANAREAAIGSSSTTESLAPPA